MAEMAKYTLVVRACERVSRHAQTTGVSAIGGLRSAAPCSVAAASARGCGKGGVRDQPEVHVPQMLSCGEQVASNSVREEACIRSHESL